MLYMCTAMDKSSEGASFRYPNEPQLCRPPCSVLSPALISFVAHIADYCSLRESLLTVAWINLLFLVDSRFLPCRCNTPNEPQRLMLPTIPYLSRLATCCLTHCIQESCTQTRRHCFLKREIFYSTRCGLAVPSWHMYMQAARHSDFASAGTKLLRHYTKPP
jgi:hypothetical protein